MFSHRCTVWSLFQVEMAYHLDEFLINCLLEGLAKNSRNRSSDALLMIPDVRILGGIASLAVSPRPATSPNAKRPALVDLKDTQNQNSQIAPFFIFSRLAPSRLRRLPSVCQALPTPFPTVCTGGSDVGDGEGLSFGWSS